MLRSECSGLCPNPLLLHFVSSKISILDFSFWSYFFLLTPKEASHFCALYKINYYHKINTEVPEVESLIILHKIADYQRNLFAFIQ